MNPPKAFALLGPTASGKTGLALEVAARLPVEIISLDSALVYRGMDIGTAKPTAAERRAAPHHLIDIITPTESYSAADFVADCIRLVDEIHRRGRLPLIVGGTMMYYHALTTGLNSLPQADPDVRAALQVEKAAFGLEFLYRRLQTVDPATAARLKPNDSQRIERALEVFEITGKPLSSHFAGQATAPALLNLHTAALIPADRARLHQNITLRFTQMLHQGLVGETAALRRRYPELTPDHPSMRCVGYRQAWAYLEGEYGDTRLAETGIAATRQLAKRQLTWLRKIPLTQTLDPFTDRDHIQTACESVKRHFGV